MVKDKAMLPTNDYIFKRIFGHEGNEEITKGLISSIINRDIKKIKLDGKKILEKDLKDDKIGILDIRADLDDNQVCNIEMQLVRQDDIDKRLMFYWSKLYYSEIQSGQVYDTLQKTISILIANFELENIKEISKFHTKWEIREEEYTKIILTDVLEIHIIELPKLIKQLKTNELVKKDKLTLWSLFIIDPERIGEKDMNENKDIKMASEELEKIQEDEREQYLAHLRQKHILDTKAVEKYGYRKGEEDGIKKGIKQGKVETQKEIILNMHKMNFNVEDISVALSLSKEEVEKIIKEANC